MSFGLLKGNTPPIAVDFGVASLKALQIMQGDERTIIASARAFTPDELIDKPAERLAYQSGELARMLRSADFRGKRAVCSVSATLTFVQHIQVQRVEGMTLDGMVSQRVAEITNRPASSYILRRIEVGEVMRGGARRDEIICVAIPREAVMSHMRALRTCKLEPVGVHTEHLALVRSIDHITRRTEDASLVTLLIDIGYGSTRIVVTHGQDAVIARTLLVGGRQLDAMSAKQSGCDLGEAHRRRVATLAMRTPHSVEEGVRRPVEAALDGRARTVAPAPHSAVVSTLDDRRVGARPVGVTDLDGGVALPERARAVMDIFRETLCDEIALAVRYHRALFPDRSIGRTIFFGGESMCADLCRRISDELRLDASLGDPLSLFRQGPASEFTDAGGPTPEWAVALGLCVSPTDL